MAENEGSNGAEAAAEQKMKATAGELERMIVDGKFQEAFEGAASFHAQYPNSGPAKTRK